MKNKQGFPFICTHCGKQLDQESIRFDMIDILNRGDKNYNILKLYMTEQMVNGLQGKDMGDEDHRYRGLVRYRLSEEDLVGVLLNADNLNVKNREQITVAKISEIINEADDEKILKEIETLFSEVISRQGKEQISKDDKVKRLLEELKSLIECAEPGESGKYDFEFVMRKIYDQKTKILTGHAFYQKNGMAMDDLIKMEARCCPVCHTPVFHGAGTAPQKSLVFVGEQGSGKTSTMVAMAHYLRYAHIKDKGISKTSKLAQHVAVWKRDGIGSKCGNESCKLIDNVELVKCSRFDLVQKEMDDFSDGFAPRKTQTESTLTENQIKGEGKAYSITLKIVDNAQKTNFLTLLDVPGEMFETDGRIKESYLQGFPYTNFCDGFILCYEHPRESESDGNTQVETTTHENVSEWIVALQNRRREISKKKDYAPIMLLLTKCPSFEHQGRDPELDERKKKYMLEFEYQAVKDVFEVENIRRSVNNAFYATMRCSPFGYRAVKRVEKDDETASNRDRLRPVNIGTFAQWCLYISGCIPTSTDQSGNTYFSIPDDPKLSPIDKYAMMQNVSLSYERGFRNKYRYRKYVRDLRKNSQWEVVRDIALARWILFKNGERDREYAKCKKFCRFCMEAKKTYRKRLKQG